jgi:hypothetical protein
MSLGILSKLCAPQDRGSTEPSGTFSFSIKAFVEANALAALSVTQATSLGFTSSKGTSGIAPSIYGKHQQDNHDRQSQWFAYNNLIHSPRSSCQPALLPGVDLQ